MGQSNKTINYKYEPRKNTTKSGVYVVDIIHNKIRYKYTYSIAKYGEEAARELASIMADLLTKALIEQSIDIESVSKINNLYKEFDDYVEIYSMCASTNKMHTILVDKEDFDKVKGYYWSLFNANKKFNNIYATTTKDGKAYRLSHLVLGLTNGNNLVRYKNGNQLDNRKSNLIVCAYNNKTNDGITMTTSPSKSSLVGRIRIVNNSFQVNYCIDQESNTWDTKVFDISDYDSMEDAYKQAKLFRNSFDKSKNM